MFLFAGYFDESTDEDSTAQCYTVAGYIGPQLPALILDLRWKDVLKRYNLRYFKASEIERGWGEFKQHRENLSIRSLTASDRELQKEIKGAFLDIICDDDDGLRGISASVLIQDWNAFHDQEPVLSKKLPANMYTLCSQLMLMEAGLTQYDHNLQSPEIGGVMRPIFDSHYKYEPAFRQAFSGYARKNPRSSRYLLEPRYEREQDYRCLQAADLLCYEVRRSVAAHFREPDYQLQIPMQRLLSKQAKMYVLNYEVLESLARYQKSDEPGINPIYRRTERPTRRQKLRPKIRKSADYVGALDR